ncbi:hypothetical protein [Actinomadura montaniterrae]|uniref:hypothetical protein n=1 Tax=Actinomadura montaniterrae TaxID=1803903 RepID=UPI00178C5070|nr:hypothetical protein [Actinomadura montaniterrae]
MRTGIRLPPCRPVDAVAEAALSIVRRHGTSPEVTVSAGVRTSTLPHELMESLGKVLA